MNEVLTPETIASMEPLKHFEVSVASSVSASSDMPSGTGPNFETNVIEVVVQKFDVFRSSSRFETSFFFRVVAPVFIHRNKKERY